MYDSGGQQEPMKNCSEMKLLLKTPKKSKQSKLTIKEAIQTRRTTSAEKFGLSRFDDNILESIPFGYKIREPLKTGNQKTVFPNVGCGLAMELGRGKKQFTVSAFLKTCMIDKRRRAYVFSNNYTVNFLI